MARFAGLDKLENLQARVFKGTKKRRVGDARDDEISEKLSRCQTPDEVATYANDEGVPEPKIRDLAKRAANFGQFRMTMGNLVRGVHARVKQAAARGFKLNKEQCGSKESMRAAVIALKPKKEPKAKAEKKAPAAKAGKAAAKGKAPAKEAVRSGASSKVEAAKRGKGGKRKAAAATTGTAAPEAAEADGGVATAQEDVGAAPDAEDVPGQQTFADVVG